MPDKLSDYYTGNMDLPAEYYLWPLYGAGFENMGLDGKPIRVPMPKPREDELLVRHDACGLCFSDIKVISQGQNHPRIFRDMKSEPVVLGHEVSMTIMEVGENLKEMYNKGDRLTIEADIYVNNVSLAYGYTFQGGLSQYAIIDPRVIHSDSGNNLIPIRDSMGYAESALTEPWACVIAAYRLQYRNKIKPNGIAWIIGSGGNEPYEISSGFDSTSHPKTLLLTNVPESFHNWLINKSSELNIEVIQVPDPANPPIEFIDDIILLGADAGLIEMVSSHLSQFGIMAILAKQPMERKVNIDVGRIHYHRWLYVGCTEADVSLAYTKHEVNAGLRPGGKSLFVGAGGPIGRMHVQRAIQFSDPPSVVVCTDVSDMRLSDLCESYAKDAKDRGIEFVCLNPMNKPAYEEGLARFFNGFDNVVVLAPVPAVIADSATHLSAGGVMNVFAGVARGTMVPLDMSDVYLRGVRIIGHSGSDMNDMLITLQKAESNQLSLNKSVAAIGSLSAARDGLLAVKNTVYPGKVVIYPNIKELPLTAITDLKDVLPSVYAKLENGREWTNQAEQELLRIMLP